MLAEESLLGIVVSAVLASNSKTREYTLFYISTGTYGMTAIPSLTRATSNSQTQLQIAQHIVTDWAFEI